MKYFYKCFKISITLDQNIWKIIIILVVFNFLYQNFNIIITNLLKIDNKLNNYIQNILQLKKVENISK